MQDIFLRTRMILGDAAMESLAGSHVAVFGLGGVGSYAAEALARSGVGELTLVDRDTVSPLQYQPPAVCPALHHRASPRLKADRPALPGHQSRTSAFTPFTRPMMPSTGRTFSPRPKYDFIVDAIDLVSCKLDLISPSPRPRASPSSAPWAPATSWTPPACADHGHFQDLRLSPGPGHAPGAEGPGHPPSAGGLQP